MRKQFARETDLGAIGETPSGVKMGNRIVLVDGNHRTNAAFLNGHKTIRVNVLSDLSGAQVPDYLRTRK
jgi:hypothetical protein